MCVGETIETPRNMRKTIGVDVVGSPRRNGKYVSPRKIERKVFDESSKDMLNGMGETFENSVGTYMNRLSLLATQSQSNHTIDIHQAQDQSKNHYQVNQPQHQANQNSFDLYSYLQAEIGAAYQRSPTIAKVVHSNVSSTFSSDGTKLNLRQHEEGESYRSTGFRSNHGSFSSSKPMSSPVSVASPELTQSLDCHEISNDAKAIYQTNIYNTGASSASSQVPGERSRAASDKTTRDEKAADSAISSLEFTGSTNPLSRIENSNGWGTPIKIRRGKQKMAVSDIFELDNAIKSKTLGSYNMHSSGSQSVNNLNWGSYNMHSSGSQSVNNLTWGAHSMHSTGSHSASSLKDDRCVREESHAMSDGRTHGSLQNQQNAVKDLENIESFNANMRTGEEERSTECDYPRSPPMKVPKRPNAVVRTAADIYDLENAITSKVGGKSRSYYGKFQSKEGNMADKAPNSSPENLKVSPSVTSDHSRPARRSSVKPRLSVKKAAGHGDRSNSRLRRQVVQGRRNTVSGSISKSQNKDDLELYVSRRNFFTALFSTRSLHATPKIRGNNCENIEATIDALLGGSIHNQNVTPSSLSLDEASKASNLEESIDSLLMGSTDQVAMPSRTCSSNVRTLEVSDDGRKQDVCKSKPLSQLPFIKYEKESLQSCAMPSNQIACRGVVDNIVGSAHSLEESSFGQGYEGEELGSPTALQFLGVGDDPCHNSILNGIENQQSRDDQGTSTPEDAAKEKTNELKGTSRLSLRNIFKGAFVRLHFNSARKLGNNKECNKFVPFANDEVSFNREMEANTQTSKKTKRKRGMCKRFLRKLKRRKSNQ